MRVAKPNTVITLNSFRRKTELHLYNFMPENAPDFNFFENKKDIAAEYFKSTHGEINFKELNFVRIVKTVQKPVEITGEIPVSHKRFNNLKFIEVAYHFTKPSNGRVLTQFTLQSTLVATLYFELKDIPALTRKRIALIKKQINFDY